MQDIHSIAGGNRLFGGGGGGDRRLRPHLHHHQNHQALKCPRCDSLNTKFCYYNNYNLSQPRHFCKSCRRYWTKGGVLRNVPVGGGCRKTKRSSSSSSKSKSTTSDASPHPPPPRQRKSTSHSSSESSSLTASTTTAAAAATEAVSAPSSTLLFPPSTNPNFEPTTTAEGGIFSEIGSFTSLITSCNETLAFGFGNMAEEGMNHHQFQNQWAAPPPQRMMDVDEEVKMQEMNQTAQVDAGSNIGFGALDWQTNGDHQHQILFDLPNAVDHGYWSQNQWSDQDHANLYLP